MIKYFFIVIIIYFLYNKKYQESVLFSLVTFPTLSLFSFGDYSMLSVIMLLLMFIIFRTYSWERFRSFPLAFPFALCFASYMLTFFFKTPFRIGQLINIFTIFLMPILTWIVYEPESKGAQSFRKIFYIYMTILACYGIWEGFSGYNPIIESWNAENLITTPEQREDYVRFGIYRAQSLTIWCSVFGTSCAIAFVFFLNRLMDKKNKMQLFNIVFLILCIVGVFVCGTRTVFIAACIMSLSIAKYFKHAKWIVYSALSVLGVYYSFQDFFDQIIDSVINHEDTEGSSMALREIQFSAAYVFFQDAPILGNGLGYTIRAIEKSTTLYGAESILFTLMIERGMFGIVSTAFLWIYSVVYLIRKGHPFLAFIVVGLSFAKVMSLIPSISEMYIYCYVFILMKDEYNNCQIEKT